MSRILSFLLPVFFFLNGYCQKTIDEKKSIRFLSELRLFQSENEKQLFETFAAGNQPDYLSLYLVPDSSIAQKNLRDDARSRIEFFINKSATRKEGYNTKDLKRIYKDIHSEFFTKYIDNPAFDQVFVNGNYNCATASALFSILLDKLSIDYNIRETPDHVYLIAAPGVHNIIFETTAPGARILELNDKAKNQYLEYLYNNKLISKDEWQTVDKKKLFEQYYYNDEIIDKRKLAGLLYYNRGIEGLSNEKFKDAYTNFEKAYFLYPSARIKYFVTVTLASLLVSKDVNEDETAYLYFLRFADVSEQAVATKMLLEYMESMTQKLLFKNPQPEKYNLLYKTVSATITDTASLKDLRYMYYYHTAHYYTIKHKYDSSLIYLDSVYALNKEDLLVQELITGTMEEIIRSLHNDEKAAMDSLEKFFNRYSFIDRNGKYGEIHAYYLARIASQNFSKDKKKEGDVYLASIENIIAHQPEISKKVEQYFAAAFIENYYYYVRRKQYKEAKAFILQAAKYYSANEDIKAKLKWIDEVLQTK